MGTDMIRSHSYMEGFNVYKIKMAIKVSVFIIIALTIILIVNTILKPKFFYNDMWGITSTCIDFYELEKDSVDVLFLGSSHAGSFFNPQVLYDTYGITSYNLSSEVQSVLVSYYWLQEALKYQSPKLVVLDTYTLHKYQEGGSNINEKLNSSEPITRKAIDYMRWSKVKMDAVHDIVKLDPSQSEWSYYLPNIRYHNRWYTIQENDIKSRSMAAHGGIKGFLPILKTDRNIEYQPFTEGDSSEIEPFLDTMGIYLDKICDLCKAKGIELILVNVPAAEPIQRYNATNLYAKSRNIDYYDFNESKLYNSLGYDASAHGLSHANIWGAAKITSYMGQLFVSKYGILPKEDKSFDKSRMIYTNIIKDCELANSYNLYEYLDKLADDRYSLIVVGRAEYFDDEMVSKFENLCFVKIRDLYDEDYYIGVKADGKVDEKFGKESISYSGSIRNGYVPCVIKATALSNGDDSISINVDNKEWCNNSSGIHIVVYDNDKMKVSDSVCFVMDGEDNEVYRDEIIVDGNVIVLKQ